MNLKNHLQACKCVICFWFFIYLNKKITCEFANVQYHFFPLFVSRKNHLWVHKCEMSFFFIYLNKKNLIVNSQVCNIIFFLLLRELKKSLICSQVWNIIFSLTYVNNFFFCKPTNVQYYLLFPPTWVEKTACKLSSVQYNFFFSPMGINKTNCKLVNV
jgi:hypothetical protein